MRVSLRVRELADARGWDVAELARQAGVDPRTAQSMYAGEPVEMDLATQGQLAQALGVLPNDLVAQVEEPQPSAMDAPAPRDESVPLGTPGDQDRPGAL